MTAVRERLEALISSVLATLETASYTYTTLDIFGSEEPFHNSKNTVTTAPLFILSLLDKLGKIIVFKTRFRLF